jgi:endonuclease/exonuclease/phosphatase family metal-dependent hydrolase
LKEVDADIIALQEVVCVEGKTREDHQAQYLADELEAHVEFGENRRHKDGGYGNVLLSRFPIHHAENYDLSVRGRERRGCLRVDLRLGDAEWLHIFNLHLGTSFFERREQARKLFGQPILTDEHLPGNKIVLGDFNEWTKGLASRLLRSHFRRADSGTPLATQTYPGLLPVLRLDYLYFDRELNLDGVTIHRSRTAILASDHLPLVAEFSIPVTVDQSAPARLLTSLSALRQTPSCLEV